MRFGCDKADSNASDKLGDEEDNSDDMESTEAEIIVDEAAAKEIVSEELDPDDPVRKHMELIAKKVISKAKRTPHTSRSRSKIPGAPGAATASRKASPSPCFPAYRSLTPQVKRSSVGDPDSKSESPPGKAIKTLLSPGEGTKSMLAKILSKGATKND